MNTSVGMSSALRVYSPEKLMEFFTGIEYYMEIVNEFFCCYTADIEKQVRECPLFKHKVKQKLNTFFNLVHRFDKRLAGEGPSDYMYLVAEIHDRMDEYLQDDIFRFENAVFLSVARQGIAYPEVFAKLYTALILTNYADTIYGQYRGRLNSIDRRVKFYFRMLDPTPCNGAIRDGFWHLCNSLGINPSVGIVKDDSVNIGFKIIDNKLADVDTILKIIVQAKNYVEGCSSQN